MGDGADGLGSGAAREEPLQLERAFDVVVVGSGPGGATVALELTRRGRRVLVVERGGAEPVTGGVAQTVRELWTPGRGLSLTRRLLGVLHATTLGGTSIYAWATAAEPPRAMFARHGIDLEADVESARHELPVAPLPLELIGPTARRILESAADLGLDWRPLPKLLYQDRLGGPPLGSYGAPSYEAKWNARMAVAEAVAGGATVLLGARATRVVVEDGVAVGLELVHRGRRRIVRAAKVVLSAGAIGTAVLLRASGIAGAGTTFFCDPLVAVSGSLPGWRHGPELPMTAGLYFEEEGYLLTDMSLPPWLYALATAQVGRVDRLLSYPATATIMVKVRDDVAGRVTARGGIDKPLTDADRGKLDRGAARAREILAHAGARRLSRSWYFAAHPGGTAPIGRVVDSDLQTEIRNLHVCDASVIPEPWGLPPTLTLVALGKRLAAHLTSSRAAARRPPAEASTPAPV